MKAKSQRHVLQVFRKRRLVHVFEAL